MRISPQKTASWTKFGRERSDERLACLGDKRFGNAKARHVTRTMAGKNAVRSLRLHELDLDDRWTRLIDTGHAAARHRFQGEQRHGCGAVACGRGCNVHLSV